MLFAFFILAGIFAFVFNTIVSMQLISWFILPISFAHAAGLNLLVGYYMARTDIATKKSGSIDDLFGRVLGKLGIGVIALCAGYVIKSFM